LLILSSISQEPAGDWGLAVAFVHSKGR